VHYQFLSKNHSYILTTLLPEQ
jgi:isopenicillin N synthase-like dioxygenase